MRTSASGLDQLIGDAQSFPRGATIFQEGRGVRALYLIVSGVVKLLCNRDGQEVLVAIRAPGWLLAAAPAILGRPHGATGVALTDCDVRPLPIAHFHSLRKSDGRVSDWLQAMLAQEVSEQFWRTSFLAASDCRTRVEQLFVDLCRVAAVAAKGGALRLTVHLSVTDVAALVLAGRERVSRVLTELAAERILVREKDWVMVPAESPLRARIRVTR